MSKDLFENPEIRKFIQDHLLEDVNKLLLNPPKGVQEHIAFIAEQIQSRQKLRKKVPSWYENPRLIFPPPLSAEQASSEVTSKYKSNIISGKKLVDLTGGTGIDSFSFSKSFEKLTYVEISQELCRRTTYNAAILRRKIEVTNQDCIQYLQSSTPNQGVSYYIDPARRNEGNKVFRLEECQPNLHTVLKHIGHERVLIKLSPLIDIHSCIQEVGYVVEVHVVAVKNECKEVLVLRNPKVDIEEPKIVATNLDTDQPSFSFFYSKEREVQVELSEPLDYLYEPNAAILKAGGFKTTGALYNLKKIANNTHIYTSNSCEKDFPGRRFCIEEILHRKTEIQSQFPQGKGNIISRNYPLSAEQLKRKYRMKDGGEKFLIAFSGQRRKYLTACIRER